MLGPTCPLPLPSSQPPPGCYQVPSCLRACVPAVFLYLQDCAPRSSPSCQLPPSQGSAHVGFLRLRGASLTTQPRAHLVSPVCLPPLTPSSSTSPSPHHHLILSPGSSQGSNFTFRCYFSVVSRLRTVRPMKMNL